ncbi:MAG: aminoacyl-tRNA hydrolase [Bacteroidetes bacterium]|nr:aminoacyl-tRNA hydrolase [Bacteroidota bacterium]
MKYLIVGLGNIGDEYANTRHNIGFVVADAFTFDRKVEFASGRYASVAKASLKGRNFIVIKPTTYMNLSGKAVRYWMTKEDILPENILVIVDDLALPLGSLRLRKKGSDGGHNGLISIIEEIGTNEFARLRIGIGDDFAKGRQVDYVLSRWTKEEEKVLLPKITSAVDIIKNFALVGIDRTMNLFNTKPEV